MYLIGNVSSTQTLGRGFNTGSWKNKLKQHLRKTTIKYKNGVIILMIPVI